MTSIVIVPQILLSRMDGSTNMTEDSCTHPIAYANFRFHCFDQLFLAKKKKKKKPNQIKYICILHMYHLRSVQKYALL